MSGDIAAQVRRGPPPLGKTDMEYLIGVLLALGIAAGAAAVGADRDRVFYPMMLVVIASYYVLFAVMGGAASALLIEAGVMGGFVVVAVMGFKHSPWLVVAALAGHGALDLIHPHLIANPGVPPWWPMFCMAFDLTAAAALAARLAVAGGSTGRPRSIPRRSAGGPPDRAESGLRSDDRFA